MEFLQHIKTVLRQPLILRPYHRILLLSHMRANTSLFGHLLGSHPEIDGYYELHIGYYSWKSFIRQKLIYFAEHQSKPDAKYIFDKVLASEHDVNTSLFENSDDKVIFMLREPNATIASIIKLYQKVEPDHEYTTLAGASQYYSERLMQMVTMAKNMKGSFIFIEAEAITQTPDEILAALSDYLALTTPLSKEYKILPKTGEKRAGDSSKNINSGVITAKDTVVKPLEGLDPKVITQYEDALGYFRQYSLINTRI